MPPLTHEVPAPQRPVAAGRGLALAVVVAVGAGVLTAYAQGLLPDGARSVANSAGSWTVIAFGLALLAVEAPVAALTGGVALLGLLGGYLLGAGVRGFPASSSLLLFWGLASVLVGPAVGLAAFWVRTRRPVLAGVGAGLVAGILVGEGVYGLTYLRDSTPGPFWVAEAAAGVVLLLAATGHQPDRGRAAAVAAPVALAVAGAFVLVYSQDLIALL